MMNILLRSVQVIDPRSKFHDQVLDIHIHNGKIIEIGEKLTANKQVKEIQAKGNYLMLGMLDLNCSIGEPGFETKETLHSAMQTAAAGGFTAITCLPNTFPIIQSRSEVKYILNATKNQLVSVLPLGALTENLVGEELTEMYDMQSAGAVAFSNGNKAVSDDGMMYRALTYAKGVDALVISFPENKSISGQLLVQESEVSTLIGIQGAPAIAEEMQIMRDIYLAQYLDYKIHISSISTANSVALIKQAKKNGVKITCDVALHNLLYTEKELLEFDSNYKFKPVLRSKSDVKALISGLKEGSIDAIVSQHSPHEVEFKEVEFQIAKTGNISLQTVLNQLIKLGLSLDLITEKLVYAPNAILKRTAPSIGIGDTANCFLFDASQEWIYNDESNQSISKNTPLYHQKLKGKVLLTINNNQIVYH